MEALLNNPLVILFAMMLLHVTEDFRLQGIMANMKQKSWWKKQEGYSELYENDYIFALWWHAFQWSCFINIPLLLYSSNTNGVLLSVLLNAIFHALVDNLKANKLKINLIMDQTLHVFQIVLTWFLVVFVV